MRSRKIEIITKDIKDGQYYIMSEYNEYDQYGSFVQTLSRTYHYFSLETSDLDMIEWIRINEYKQDIYSHLEKTECVYTYIEERRPPDYIRYINTHGKRWEVIGICNGNGACWQNSPSPKPELDSVISWTYTGECCPFIINIL